MKSEYLAGKPRPIAGKTIGGVLVAVVFGLTRLAAAGDTLAVPDDEWHLWPDTKAPWSDDTLYLPDETADLTKLPVNPPSGGWGTLDTQPGITVALPSTVEQHFWGQFGLRQCDSDEYDYAPKKNGTPSDPVKIDPDAQIGNYQGVSWWWRSVEVPATFHDKVVLLHIRGGRQRAEVFVNRQLVGYDLIEETSFDCDVSKAIRAGQSNEIAIRITNPGGRMDWIDYNTTAWGKYLLPCSHGFGGLDRGMTLTAHDPVYLQDVWVLNTPAARSITAHASVRNTTNSAWQGNVHFEITAPATDAVQVSADSPVRIAARESVEVQVPMSDPQAELWELNAPHLYNLRAHLETSSGPQVRDDDNRPFGFRWFEPRGIGQSAGLYLNDRRVRLYTAISWGYWGLNGVWPTPELADKEVRAAKQLNLNMLNFHRDVGKEDVLAKQDELGLLRYMESGDGGGYFKKLPRGATQPSPTGTSAAGGEATTFFQRYLEAKITRMVRQFRSHPSLVIYVLQNETEPDLSDPHLYYLLQKVHELDPSRVVAAKSGIAPHNQAWFAPYGQTVMIDDGTGYSGWRDEHTVGGPGVWQDDFYKGPDKFVNQIDDRREIVDWGEMLGAAVADNHPQMVEQIKSLGGKSYDLQVHEQLADTYDQFWKKWGFRQAFPTDDTFYRDLGNKEYEFWARVIETSRLSESNDILTISGWESTAIENHSGLVDNLRNFHGDPAVLAPKLAPVLPVAETHSAVLNTGDAATVDIFLVNETGRAATGHLDVTLKDPSGAVTNLASYPVPDYVKDQFVYLVKTNLKTPALNSEGKYSVQIALDSEPEVRNSQSLLVIRDIAPDVPAATVGVLGDDTDLAIRKLAAFPNLKVEPYRDGGKYDLIVAASAITLRKPVPGNTTQLAASALAPVIDPPPILTDGVLQSIRGGTPLLVLAGDYLHGNALAKALANAGAFEYSGPVPPARASWMGNWIFVRADSLYEGLPVNEVMKGDYQVSVKLAYGLMVDGPNVQIVAGYGRDHDRNLGAATFTTRLDNTPIVFQAVNGMHPVMEERFLGNALRVLIGQKQ